MSVDELRARIAKLSTEIDLQKELLKSCRSGGTPLEVSSEIFLQSLPLLPEPVARGHSPLLLLNICNIWTDIALPTPALWANIHIVSPCAEGFRVLPIWLGRAGNHPLSISLRVRGNSIDKDVASLVREEGPRLMRFGIDYESRYNDDEDIIDLFGGSSPGEHPLLQTLVIRAVPQPSICSCLQTLELLHLTPNLAELSFENITFTSTIPLTAEPVVLPTLRLLTFGEGGTNPDSDDAIILYLSLPALEILSLSFHSVSSNGLCSFLQRSSPPLQELVLGDALDDADAIRLLEALRLVPILRRLEVWGPTPSVATGLATALAGSPLLIPNLHTFVLRLYDWPHIPHSCWESLIAMLVTRRPSLRTFQIHLSGSTNPPYNILKAFRTLGAAGMQIYIGNTSKSCLRLMPGDPVNFYHPGESAIPVRNKPLLPFLSLSPKISHRLENNDS
ncbi:hypothetical protein DFH06DRAFT_1332975 [Mycena polygramma]|nr:hypothetical protein DFH06DRAFT_1332975 [Mycena polygramma]